MRRRNAKEVREAIADAVRTAEVMAEAAARKSAVQEAKSGLVILRAVYGARGPLFAALRSLQQWAGQRRARSLLMRPHSASRDPGMQGMSMRPAPGRLPRLAPPRRAPQSASPCRVGLLWSRTPPAVASGPTAKKAPSRARGCRWAAKRGVRRRGREGPRARARQERGLGHSGPPRMLPGARPALFSAEPVFQTAKHYPE